MSPLWRERWRVALCPQALVVARLGRGLRPRLREGWSEPLAAAGTAEPAWKPATDALQRLLAGKARGAELTVILSNHFVRYLVVPWQPELTGAEERLALARHAFSEVYGEVASTWRIRLSDDAWGAPAVASAVDDELLDAVEAAARAAGTELASVQPYWMSAFNQFRRELGASGCFGLVEPGKLCLGVYRDESWQGLSARRLPPGAELGTAVTQEIVALDGDPPDRVLLHLAEEGDMGRGELPGGFRVLQLPLPEAQRPLAMALCGALRT